MKDKRVFILLLLFLIVSGKVYSQVGELSSVEYKLVAEGMDSPISSLQIVCFNKYFNKDYLPVDFRKKYKLDDKKLYKKKMLVEIFQSDKNGEGIDKINLLKITENDTHLIIEYDIINSNVENDDKHLSPFLIVQVPKSRKAIKFIANGVELGKATDIYVD